MDSGNLLQKIDAKNPAAQKKQSNLLATFAQHEESYQYESQVIRAFSPLLKIGEIITHLLPLKVLGRYRTQRDGSKGPFAHAS